MMRVLYGVVGAGMGHAIRSAVVIDHLLGEGHDVHIVCSGSAVKYLRERFGGVTEIWGLSIVTEGNQVDPTRTLGKNLSGALRGLPEDVVRFVEVESAFRPEVVVSDFESWSWFFGKIFDVPIICIDNIQILNRCTHDEAIIAGDRDSFNLAKNIVKARTAKADWYLVTTFFYPPVRKKRTELVPPILRQTVLDAVPTDAGHLLVYQTADTFADLPRLLQRLDLPVLIYGLRKVQEPVTEGNLTFKPFSDAGFVADLASAHAVCASAGFTLSSESVHLGKPYLATPVGGQFEQTLNARYIHELGYGTYDTNLDLRALTAFLERADEHRAHLATYERHDNSRLFARLDELLDQAAAGLL